MVYRWNWFDQSSFDTRSLALALIDTRWLASFQSGGELDGGELVDVVARRSKQEGWRGLITRTGHVDAAEKGGGGEFDAGAGGCQEACKGVGAVVAEKEAELGVRAGEKWGRGGFKVVVKWVRRRRRMPEGGFASQRRGRRWVLGGGEVGSSAAATVDAKSFVRGWGSSRLGRGRGWGFNAVEDWWSSLSLTIFRNRRSKSGGRRGKNFQRSALNHKG